MTLDRKELKRQAKDAMRAARPSPYWVTMLLLVITLLLNVLGMSLNGTLEAYRVMLASALEGQMVYVEPRSTGGMIGWLLQMALEVMGIEMTVGFILYSLRIWRREKAGFGDLFDGFGVFFRSIWIQLLPALLVSLWSLIYMVPVTTMIVQTGNAMWLLIGLPLLIPALMASYSYRLAVYIMLDDPAMGCFQCVAMSREIMRGHRWELFKLDLSFVGWSLLCALVPVAGLLLAVWLAAYMQVTFAGYYVTAARRFMACNAPPVESQTPMQ